MEANETFTVSVVSTNATDDVITFNPASQSGLIQDTTSKINMTIWRNNTLTQVYTLINTSLVDD